MSARESSRISRWVPIGEIIIAILTLGVFGVQVWLMGRQTTLMEEQKNISAAQTKIAETQTEIQKHTLQTQVKPIVVFSMQTTSVVVPELVVENAGVYEVLDVGVDREWTWFFNPVFDPQAVKKVHYPRVFQSCGSPVR
jgi:hypothetical protein